MRDSIFIWIQRLLPQHALSRLAGWLAASEIPWLKQRFIDWFVRRYQVDLSEAATRDFASFNAFFTRALIAGARPIASAAVVSPADGAVSQIGHIRGSDVLQAKGQYFSLHDLLGGDAVLTSEFINGEFATVYLSPRDYHRVHMPVTGTLRQTIYVPGKLFSVNQTTSERVPGLFARNERLVCVFDTELGPMAVILVGAMIVAAIETVFAGQVTPQSSQVQRIDYGQHPMVLQQGEELGRFKLGSTAIVLFGPQRCRWLEHLKAGTTVRMGEALGTSAGEHHE